MPKPINISASRGAGILGMSKWKTQVQAWLEMMEQREPGFCEENNYLKPEFEYNSAMKWGHAFEDAVIELAEERQGTEIVNREFLFTCESADFLTCHVDGMYYKHTLHEGKTTNLRYYRDYFGEPGTDRVPVEYQIQCQHQMICTGAEKVILSVLVFPKMVTEWEEMGIMADHDLYNSWELVTEDDIYDISEWARVLSQMGFFHQYEITANPELQSLMIEKYTQFWNENIIGRKPPEAVNMDDLKALVREPVGTIIADERTASLMAEYKQIKSEIGSGGMLSKRAESIRTEVMKYMAESVGVIDDDTQDKFILRDEQGKKLAQYSQDKNGKFIFR